MSFWYVRACGGRRVSDRRKLSNPLGLMPMSRATCLSEESSTWRDKSAPRVSRGAGAATPFSRRQGQASQRQPLQTYGRAERLSIADSAWDATSHPNAGAGCVRACRPGSHPRPERRSGSAAWHLTIQQHGEDLPSIDHHADEIVKRDAGLHGRGSGFKRRVARDRRHDPHPMRAGFRALMPAELSRRAKTYC